jgi:hypothetical protein
VTRKHADKLARRVRRLEDRQRREMTALRNELLNLVARTRDEPLRVGLQYAVVYRIDPTTGQPVRGIQTANGWSRDDA